MTPRSSFVGNYFSLPYVVYSSFINKNLVPKPFESFINRASTKGNLVNNPKTSRNKIKVDNEKPF